MTINEEREHGVVVVSPVGRVDNATSARLDEYFTGLAAAGESRVVVDFSGIDYISSAGLRVMLTLAKRAKDQKARVALFAMNDSVRQVFELAGFLTLFAVTASRDDAVRRVTQ